MILLCGISGSGKSSVAAEIQKNNQNTVIVSSDSLREELFGDYENQDHNKEVFEEFHRRIRDNLKNNINVIADATNLTMKSRRAILNNISDLDVYKICYITPKPFALCVRDNSIRPHSVPLEVISQQVKRFQVPFDNEGYDKIIASGIKDHNNSRISWEAMVHDMFGYNQYNPHHIFTLDWHCILTYQLFENYIDSKYDKSTAYKLAAKLHDFGKIFVRTFDDDGIAHYYNHAEFCSYFLLSQLELPEEWSDKDLLDCCFLVNYHMLPFGWKTDKTKQRWKERFGEYKYNLLMDFHKCDMEAANGQKF